MLRHPLLLLAIAGTVTACDSGVETRKAALPDGDVAVATAAATTPATASGPAQSVQAQSDDYLQSAASVVAVTPLTAPGADAKLFGLAGGDPALNGDHAYLAFFIDPSEGWRVFPLGDFERWSLGEQGPGRFVLETTQGRMGDDGEMVNGEVKRFIVTWESGGPDAPAPSTITVTPAT
ncbi:MAG: hypothetical protein ACI9YM_002544 [Brevundimonas sp.]|jgi:hypothetical protein|uniref:hypothetical protein n=1 Tax=Brevundimonas sp. TaxID=1871086 RepID=UPI0039E39088|tara:strand:+ start:2717 stop:3250 length:534 start_codon:yes stop_codon:yes gene_type:complete